MQKLHNYLFEVGRKKMAIAQKNCVIVLDISDIDYASRVLPNDILIFGAPHHKRSWERNCVVQVKHSVWDMGSALLVEPAAQNHLSREHSILHA
jgi:hypothetical protein